MKRAEAVLLRAVADERVFRHERQDGVVDIMRQRRDGRLVLENLRIAAFEDAGLVTGPPEGASFYTLTDPGLEQLRSAEGSSPMTTTPSPREQAEAAYRRMATEANYRPAAPSDGFGNITVPLSELDLNAEARFYAESWHEQEDAQVYPVGCPDYQDRETLILVIEAARLLCGVDRPGALALLRLAAENLEQARCEGPAVNG